MRKFLLMMVCLVALGGCKEMASAAVFQAISFFTSATEADIGMAQRHRGLGRTRSGSVRYRRRQRRGVHTAATVPHHIDRETAAHRSRMRERKGHRRD